MYKRVEFDDDHAAVKIFAIFVLTSVHWTNALPLSLFYHLFECIYVNDGAGFVVDHCH